MELKKLYEEILSDDSANVQEIHEITKGLCAALDTPERRALFLLGYRNTHISTGVFLNYDQPNEKFLPLNLGVTDNDAFYVLCGQDYPPFRKHQRK